MTPRLNQRVIELVFGAIDNGQPTLTSAAPGAAGRGRPPLACDRTAPRSTPWREGAASHLGRRLGADSRRSVDGAAFGLRFRLPDYLIELYKGLKNDLPAFNDDPSWTLPMPARYVIGQSGV